MGRRFFWKESLDSRCGSWVEDEVRDLKNLIIESSSSSSSSSSSTSSSSSSSLSCCCCCWGSGSCSCWRKGRKMWVEESEEFVEVGGVEKREKRLGVLDLDLEKSESER